MEYKTFDSKDLEIISLKNKIEKLEEKFEAMNKGCGACVLDSEGIPCYVGDKVYVSETHAKQGFDGYEEDIVEFDNCILIYDDEYRRWRYKTEDGQIRLISDTVLFNGYNYLYFRRIK